MFITRSSFVLVWCDQLSIDRIVWLTDLFRKPPNVYAWIQSVQLMRVVKRCTTPTWNQSDHQHSARVTDAQPFVDLPRPSRLSLLVIVLTSKPLRGHLCRLSDVIIELKTLLRVCKNDLGMQSTIFSYMMIKCFLKVPSYHWQIRMARRVT